VVRSSQLSDTRKEIDIVLPRTRASKESSLDLMHFQYGHPTQSLGLNGNQRWRYFDRKHIVLLVGRVHKRGKCRSPIMLNDNLLS